MAAVSPIAVPSCKECGIRSAGRCPTCHRSLCMDHFPIDEHEPCASRLKQHPERYVCYVCASPAVPEQWSSTEFAHYIDRHICAGCGRYVCDERHTYRREESVSVEADGLRSHRYHTIRRYCGICARLRLLGGLRTATWVLVVLLGIICAAALVYIEVISRVQ